MENGVKYPRLVLPRLILPMLVLSVLAMAAGALATLYGRKGHEAKLAPGAQAQETLCPESTAASRRIAPLVKGEVAAMMLPKLVAPMPEVSFLGPDGSVRKLSDFRGRTILLNLWATWCIPCREEMPALDRLQAASGTADFEVVALNIDTTRLEKRQSFLETAGVKALAFYADPKADAFQQLKSANRVEGLPTSWLIGKDGCEIGTLAAKADWGSADAAALVAAALH